MSRTYESERRKSQAEETRRRILRALVDLLIEEHPATISIPQVASRAEVSVRIVYHYFASKDALFDAVIEEMPSLVAVSDDYRQLRLETPAQYIAAIPTMFRYLDTNRAVFRAVSVSELGERVVDQRRAERLARVDTAFQPLFARLEPTEQRKLRGAIGSLVSFASFDALTTTWGLTSEEAAELAAWTVQTMCDKASRSGVGGAPR